MGLDFDRLSRQDSSSSGGSDLEPAALLEHGAPESSLLPVIRPRDGLLLGAP